MTEYDYQQEYFELCFLKKDVQVIPEHNSPELFNIDNDFVEKAQQRYRLSKRDEYIKRVQEIHRYNDERTNLLRGPSRNRAEREFLRMEINDGLAEIKKLEGRIRFLSMPKSEAKSIDIVATKQVPLSEMFDIAPNRFFINNPLRTEKSPSNSFFWYKDSNTWIDFATGDHGDNIDLVMRVYELSFQDACNKILHM